MELQLRIIALPTLVLLILCDFSNAIKHKDTRDFWRNIVDDNNRPILNMAENSEVKSSRSNVIDAVNEDDDFNILSNQQLDLGPDVENKVLIEANQKRGRRHRDIAYNKTPQDLKAQLKALSVKSSGDLQGSPKEMTLIYNALVNELEDKEQLIRRLAVLETQMNKIQDVTRHMSVNVTPDENAGCNCKSAIKRDEFEVVKVHLRRMYFMLNAQDERHRDMLDLVNAYRSMVYNSADVIGQLEERILKIQSDMRRQRVQMNKLNLDMHWRHVQQDVIANDTKHIAKELGKVQRTIQGLFADHGHFYSSLGQLRISINASQLRSSQLEVDTNSLRLILQQLLQVMVHNGTGNNGRMNIMTGLLKNISNGMKGRLMGSNLAGIKGIGDGQCREPWCSQSGYSSVSGLQRQLDEIALDVEQLKDEISQFYHFLQSVQTDIRHVRRHQDEEVIRAMDVQVLKAEMIKLRQNISNIETFLHDANAEETNKLLAEHLESSPEFGFPDVSMPYKVTPTVRSSARKANVLPFKSSKLFDDLTTIAIDETDEYDVIADTPPTWTHPDEDTDTESKEVPHDSLNRDRAKPHENNEYSKDQGKLRDKSSKNDVILRTNMPKANTEAHSTRHMHSTMTPDIETAMTLEKHSTTTSPYMHQVNLNYKNGLKVKPSESDVCALPGIMVGQSTPVAKFSDIQSGAWMRDPESRNNHIYIATGHAKVKLLKEYKTTDDLVSKKEWRDFKLPIKCTGTGHVMYNGSLYCNKYKSNRIVRYDTRTNQIATHTIKSAGFGNAFPYTAGDNTDIDFGVDEIGLWVVYSGIDHHGNIVIGKVNPETLEIYPTWETGYQKKRAVNSFMVCGRLYVVSYNSAGALELSYVYDTLRGRETPSSHQAFYSITDSVSMMTYNPKDSKLYAWVRTPQWQGQLVEYGIFFIG